MEHLHVYMRQVSQHLKGILKCRVDRSRLPCTQTNEGRFFNWPKMHLHVSFRPPSADLPCSDASALLSIDVLPFHSYYSMVAISPWTNE